MATVAVTVDGIAADVNVDALDDFANLRLLAKAQKGDVIAIADFADALLGEEQVTRLMGELAKEGTCHVADMAMFVDGCITAAAERNLSDAKN